MTHDELMTFQMYSEANAESRASCSTRIIEGGYGPGGCDDLAELKVELRNEISGPP